MLTKVIGKIMNELDTTQFSTAEITVAWLETECKEKIAIFAVIELIPGVSWMETTNEPRLSNAGKVRVYTYQTQVSVEDGLKFYESGVIDNSYLMGIKFPQNTFTLPECGFTTTHREYFYHPITNACINQLLPERQTSLNVCCIFNNDDDYYRTAYLRHIDRICEHLTEANTPNVNIKDYPHLYGSRLLCFQDPIFWKINLKLDRPNKQLKVMFFLRETRELAGCHCAIQSGNMVFQQSMRLYEIKEQVMSISYQYSVSSLFYDVDYLLVWDSTGFLIEKIPLIFWGSNCYSTFKFRTLPNNERMPVWSKSYYEHRNTKPNYIEDEILKIKYLYLEKVDEYRYFSCEELHNEGNGAKQYVQSLLSKGGLEIIICDTYFDNDTLSDFILGWVNCESLIVITSSKLFRRRVNRWVKDNLPEHLEDSFVEKIGLKFQKDLQECVIRGCFKSFAIYYASNEEESGDILHDRHIIVDHNVWGIGTSLNSLGNKETTISKPQNPNAILNRIKVWRANPPVYKWSIEDDNH